MNWRWSDGRPRPSRTDLEVQQNFAFATRNARSVYLIILKKLLLKGLCDDQGLYYSGSCFPSASSPNYFLRRHKLQRPN